MIQVALEDNKVRPREVQEEVGGFIVQIPVGIARAPKGVLLIYPLALPLVLLSATMSITYSALTAKSAHLPAQAQTPQTLYLSISSLREKVPINHRVKQPVPVLLGDIGDKPRVSLPVEANLLGKAALNQEVGCVTISISIAARGYTILCHTP